MYPMKHFVSEFASALLASIFTAMLLRNCNMNDHPRPYTDRVSPDQIRKAFLRTFLLYNDTNYPGERVTLRIEDIRPSLDKQRYKVKVVDWMVSLRDDEVMASPQTN